MTPTMPAQSKKPAEPPKKARASKPTKARVTSILRVLADTYGDAECALDHKNAFELTAATILSAQCTDKRVNMVTPALFAAYPTPQALAEASQEDVETLVRTTGFFRNKAKSLIGMARGLMANYGGEIPDRMEDLLTLPGVARKTANVVLGVAFEKAEGVVVDTHVSRISQLLGLTRETSPVKIERDLMALLPRKEWVSFSHRLIHHGRAICIARRPQCDACPLRPHCPNAFRDPPAERAKTTKKKTKAAAAASRSKRS